MTKETGRRVVIAGLVLAGAVVCIPVARYLYGEWQWKRHFSELQNWDTLSIEDKAGLAGFMEGGYLWDVFRLVDNDLKKNRYNIEEYRRLLSSEEFQMLVKGVAECRKEEDGHALTPPSPP